jgi:hypothetical protein
VIRGRVAVAFLVPLVLQCGRGAAGPVLHGDAGAGASPLDAAVDGAVLDASPKRSESAPAASRVVVVPLPPRRKDAGGGACALLRGPIELPLRGGIALRVHGDAIDTVMNDDGRPWVASWPIGPATTAGAAGPEMAGRPSRAALSIPCALAGDLAFCPDRGGAVHRASADGQDQVVASSRVGARLAAATLAGGHPALVYLASRMTSEGWVSEAWLEVDDAAPVRISDDGSGATSVVLRQRGDAVVALLVDARAALTAMHVRLLGFDPKAHKPQIGEDVVVFVGGPGDRRTAPALALPAESSSSPAWALLPIGRDLSAFGLAVVRLDRPAHVDEPVVWSMYANGLDPAPVAAVASSADTVTVAESNAKRGAGAKRPRSAPNGDGGASAPETGLWVARVVPTTAAPDSPRQLELGELLGDGAFVPRDVIASSARITDVALEDDGRGAMWLGWTDASGSWLERIVCR